MESRLLKLRKTLKFTQKEFAEQLRVSSALVSLIESGSQKPSETLIELIVYKFGVERDWITNGTGEIFRKDTKREIITHSVASKAMVAAAIVGQVLPQVTLGIMASVGVSHIIQKMVKAYGAKNSKELAQKYLNVSNSTIYSWKDKEKIPEKYLEKAARDTGVPMEYLVSDDILLTMDKKYYFDFIKSLKDPVKFNEMDYYQKSNILDQYLKNIENKQK